MCNATMFLQFRIINICNCLLAKNCWTYVCNYRLKMSDDASGEWYANKHRTLTCI